jgi:fructosamine-3-kinase
MQLIKFNHGKHLMWTKISEKITQATGKYFEIVDCQTINGGCINQAYLVSNIGGDSPAGNRARYFVKLNRSDLIEMFVAEARGLSEIAATETIKVPLPICWGVVEDQSYLVLEYLDLTTESSPQNWTEMGRNLAMMHRHQISPNRQFGWHIDNTIGSTPQINTWEKDWATFFANHRIGYQIHLAQSKGGHFPKAAELMAKVPKLLANYRPKPSLVHGDLWSGNASFTNAGIPVIFDPATYWGDREVDIAMAALFGGFPNAFYQGYNDVYPLDSDYSTRKILYDLYHILNHHNLFGGNYQGQANNMIDRLLW